MDTTLTVNDPLYTGQDADTVITLGSGTWQKESDFDENLEVTSKVLQNDGDAISL